MKAQVVCFVVGFLIFWLLLSMTTIPAGHVGVVDLFGRVYDEPLTSGMALVNPFARVVKFTTKTQLVEMAEDVPTKEGLNVHLEIAALFHLQPSDAVHMYKTVGENYIEKVVVPQFRSVIRGVTSGHDAKDLYTSVARLSMSSDLKEGLNELVKNRGIVVEETPLKKLELPKTLRAAIEDKLNAEQLSQKMQFVLQRERQEAERKSIEAEGIANFQKIVSGDITEGMLKWKGIEATENLAKSDNAKIVIIGNPSTGLPLIFNSDDKAVELRHLQQLMEQQQQQQQTHTDNKHSHIE